LLFVVWAAKHARFGIPCREDVAAPGAGLGNF